MRFIHTADLQLGKPFASIEAQDKRALVQQARFETLERIRDIVREYNASFVVVAGDLFDSPSADNSTISRACKAVGSLGVPVLVIPGNHDHGGAGSVWEREFFLQEQRSLAPNLCLLLKPEPVELEEAVILPCPLLHRRVVEDPTGWLRQFNFSSLPPDKPRIVVAHGSVMDFGGDVGGTEDSDSTNFINLGALPWDQIDYLALGDWHGTVQVGERAWYSGAHEPDRFPKHHEYDAGNVLVVDVKRGATPSVEKVKTAKLRWLRLSFNLTDGGSLEQLERDLGEAVDVGKSLLRLELEGVVGLNVANGLQRLEERFRARVLHFELENRCTVLPSEQEIHSLIQRSEDPLISRVAEALYQKSRGEGDDAKVACWALNELYSAVFEEGMKR